MTQFKIITDWVSLSGHERPEVLETYANLRICIGDEVVTTVHHRPSHTTRDTVLVSLYPMAEWVASNWWALIEESDAGRRDFLDRHSLFRSREGCCLPDLRLISEGEVCRADWVPYRFVHAPIDFINGGTERIPKRDVEDTLREFIEKVCERLIGAGIRDSWLQREWTAIQETETDEEQRTFCQTAAWLGLDPFDVSKEVCQDIVQTAQHLPAYLREDAFRATWLEDLAALRLWVDTALAAMPTTGFDSTLSELRSKMQNGVPQGDPWEVGYRLARKLRTVDRDLDRLPVPIEDIFGGKLPILEIEEPPPPRAIDGLTSLSNAFMCCTSKRRPDSQRFLAARALFDFFRLDQDHSLLSSAVTTHQGEGRAFAAELLAPAEQLRARIDGNSITPEQVADVAYEWDVSSYVVGHQIRNHKIADITA